MVLVTTVQSVRSSSLSRRLLIADDGSCWLDRESCGRLCLGIGSGGFPGDFEVAGIDPKTGQPIPALATSWDANEDNSVFTFHLRDARWSDGTPITARFISTAIQGHLAVFDSNPERDHSAKETT